MPAAFYLIILVFLRFIRYFATALTVLLYFV